MDQWQRKDNENYQRNQRQCILLQLLHHTLVHHRMIQNLKEVLIINLIDRSVYSANLNRNKTDVQILRKIIPSKDQKAALYSIRRGKSQTAELHFKRVYQCRIFSVEQICEQSRLLYLMESKNSKNAMFDRNIEHRDDCNGSIISLLYIAVKHSIVGVFRFHQIQ